MNRFFEYTSPHGYRIVPTAPEHVYQLEELQNIVFPTLADEEKLRAPHYLKHIEIFPDGQYVALDGDKVIGMTTAIRYPFDVDHLDHTFADVIDGGYLTTHDDQAKWLYGADIGTHPDHRRKGIARALYAARQHCVHYHNLLGQVTVGMMSGYGSMKDEMTPEEYYEKLVAGEITDPTVSAQHRIGFELRGLIKGYLSDPVCDDCGIVLVLPAEKTVSPSSK